MSDKKVLLITGGSTGIGAATAQLAVAAGWCVGLAARSTDKLDALVAELGPERALAVGCDVTDFAEQQRMVSGVVDRFGGIDAVSANACVGGQAGGFSHAPVESWKAIVDTNILGVAYTLRATIKQLPVDDAAKPHQFVAHVDDLVEPRPEQIVLAVRLLPWPHRRLHHRVDVMETRFATPWNPTSPFAGKSTAKRGNPATQSAPIRAFRTPEQWLGNTSGSTMDAVNVDSA